MDLTEKIKCINAGIALAKMHLNRLDNIRAGKSIYCGTEDYVEFFKTVIDAIGLDIDYRVEIVDGEYEIVLL